MPTNQPVHHDEFGIAIRDPSPRFQPGTVKTGELRFSTSQMRGANNYINNCTLQDVQAVMTLIHSPQVLLGCAEDEISDAGVPHIHGFVHLTDQLYLNQILAALGGRAHCEVCVGDDAAPLGLLSVRVGSDTSTTLRDTEGRTSERSSYERRVRQASRRGTEI
jgi:hypothetical protein